jgi:hypothetical protein
VSVGSAMDMASLLHWAECLGKETMVFAKLIQVCQGLA